MSNDTSVGSERRRRLVPALYAPMRPLHNICFAMGLLVVSIVLPLVVPGPFSGTTFAAGALGVLLNVALQLRGQGADDR